MLRLVLLLHGGLLASAKSVCAPRTPLLIDVPQLRVAARSLPLNGSGLTVDAIDRQLTVAFDLPEITLPAETSSPFNQTCGRSWRCGCMRYEVCPGMQLTTAMARDFGTVKDTSEVVPTLMVRHFECPAFHTCAP
jgi:hypothetical protein